ncbi:hypothetical protein HPB50_013544 [Hyalomma asiaticum]|uniref:Uncharacterized protein n=1 Tax=Hyalomma asiaticum TaxID=266040 RepID=A0ACB7SF73_HYAAI|nr:hypothetical protein HPB50_013544 [Hyalomma asiaticum]
MTSEDSTTVAGTTAMPECDVVLFCPSVANSTMTATAPLLSFSTSSLSASGALWYHHWAVAFVYHDGSALYCDAGCDPDSGELVGGSAWKTKTQLDTMNVKKIHLGKHRIPESRVTAIIRELCTRGLYHFTKNNCQKWVTELLSGLGIEVPPSLTDAEQVVAPAATKIGFAAMLAVAFGLTRNFFKT